MYNQEGPSSFTRASAATLPRWFGRVEDHDEDWRMNVLPQHFDSIDDPIGWGYRYKVRIFGLHTGDKSILPTRDLPWANIVLPTTAGSGLGGYMETPMVSSGTVVTGFFLDGLSYQEPYIDGILINSNNNVPKSQSDGEIGGYQLFNSTYNDPNLAKVPSYLQGKGSTFTINVGDIFHFRNTNAFLQQQKDKQVEEALLSACEKDKSPLKGIRLVMSKLLKGIQEIKKVTGLVSAAAADVSSISNRISGLVDQAAGEIGSFMKTILTGVRGWVLKTIGDQFKKIMPFIFENEEQPLNVLKDTAVTAISCVFNKVSGLLKDTFKSLLSQMMDKFINAPLCAAENLLGGFLGGFLSDIADTISSVITPINAFIQGIAGQISGIAGSIMNALDFISGIVTFFTCDEEPACPQYDKISLQKAAQPGDAAGGSSKSSKAIANGAKNVQNGTPEGNQVSTDSKSIEQLRAESDAKRGQAITQADIDSEVAAERNLIAQQSPTPPPGSASTNTPNLTQRQIRTVNERGERIAQPLSPESRQARQDLSDGTFTLA